MKLDTTQATALTYGQIKTLDPGTRVYAQVSCSHETLSVAGAASLVQVPEEQYSDAMVYLNFDNKDYTAVVPEIAPSLIEFPDDDSSEIFIPLDDGTSWSYTIYLAKDIPGLPSLKETLEKELAELEAKVAGLKQQLEQLP